MSYILTNIGPILAATVAGLLIGAVYAGSRSISARLSTRPVFCLFASVSEFWLAAILAGALILAPAEGSRWVMALGSAVVIWIGFVVPTLAIGYGYRAQPLAAIVGDLLHWLVVMLAQAATMEVIGLVHP